MNPTLIAASVAMLVACGSAFAQATTPPKRMAAVPMVNFTNLMNLKRSNVQPLKPGVYLTAPFSCIVNVPASQPDDRAIIEPGQPTAPIPAIKPELRFVPWVPKK
jgi:hypothetical protein